MNRMSCVTDASFLFYMYLFLSQTFHCHDSYALESTGILGRREAETIEIPLRGTSDIEDHLDDIPAMWTKAKPEDLPDLILLTKNKSKSEKSTVTIYVWGLGPIGITVIIQCVDKEGMCSISIDANARYSTATTQIVERAMRELLEKRLITN